jgi:hypothetical protein
LRLCTTTLRALTAPDVFSERWDRIRLDLFQIDGVTEYIREHVKVGSPGADTATSQCHLQVPPLSQKRHRNLIEATIPKETDERPVWPKIRIQIAPRRGR